MCRRGGLGGALGVDHELHTPVSSRRSMKTSPPWSRRRVDPAGERDGRPPAPAAARRSAGPSSSCAERSDESPSDAGPLAARRSDATVAPRITTAPRRSARLRQLTLLGAARIVGVARIALRTELVHRPQQLYPVLRGLENEEEIEQDCASAVMPWSSSERMRRWIRRRRSRCPESLGRRSPRRDSRSARRRRSSNPACSRQARRTRRSCACSSRDLERASVRACRRRHTRRGSRAPVRSAGAHSSQSDSPIFGASRSAARTRSVLDVEHTGAGSSHASGFASSSSTSA